MSRVIVITGPTATGKTALGVSLGLRVGGEVVSADSMQIYRRMDIGTAKPTPEEILGVPHHMLSVAEPRDGWSVSRYVQEASACVDDILSRGLTPIIVGGTGLYIDSLLAGRDFAQAPGDSDVRQRLSDEYDRAGGKAMLSRLAGVDPDRAKILHAADKKRIVRALEVYELTGRTITQHDEETRAVPPRYESVKYALSFENRDDLYARIDRRVDAMMLAGLENEVRSLLADGLDDSCTAMQAIGYKEIAAALRGDVSLSDAVELIKRSSRRYAKRQLTWLRRDASVRWILWDRQPDIPAACRRIVEECSL